MNELETIRKRPGMYIGNTTDGSGLLHMVWELLANSLDEHLAGHCSRISVEISANGSITVEDDGRGIPVMEMNGVSFTEKAFTSFHNTPTMDGHAPHEHVGLHGVGAFVVCALSRSLEVNSFRDGWHFSQQFERGLAVSKLQKIEPATSTGTSVTFTPDSAIFTNAWIDPGRIASRLREISFLVPRLTLNFRDLRQHVFHEPKGLVAHVERTSSESCLATFSTFGELAKIRVEVAARWASYPWSQIESYANVERTTDGGTHVRGLLQGLSAGLKRAAPRICANRSSKEIERAISHGLTAIVCVRLNDPTYGEPTKSRLLTPEAKVAVKTCISEAFGDFLQREVSAVEHFASLLEHGELGRNRRD